MTFGSLKSLRPGFFSTGLPENLDQLAPPSRLNNKPAVSEVTVIVPVAISQVGCVTLTVGAAGTPGTLLITTLADAIEVHAPLVTVNVDVPGAKPLIVVLAPVPVVVVEVKDDVIILDANHFLAGKELVFDIELVEIA